jgi:crotonobetainyl-CoA:carnitine CoA-transferase CaiB-like acyl-CoA transferase
LRANQSLARLQGRLAQIDDVTAMIGDWTAMRTRAEICDLCDRAHVPSAPLRDVLEVVSDAHLHARGFLTDVTNETGTVALPNSPMRYEGSDLRPLTPSPLLGEHTDAVLSELCGLDSAELAELRRTGVIGAPSAAVGP